AATAAPETTSSASNELVGPPAPSTADQPADRPLVGPPAFVGPPAPSQASEAANTTPEATPAPESDADVGGPVIDNEAATQAPPTSPAGDFHDTVPVSAPGLDIERMIQIAVDEARASSAGTCSRFVADAINRGFTDQDHATLYVDHGSGKNATDGNGPQSGGNM